MDWRRVGTVSNLKTATFSIEIIVLIEGGKVRVKGECAMGEKLRGNYD